MSKHKESKAGRFSKDGLRSAREEFSEAVVNEDWEAAYDATVEMRAIPKRLGPRWAWTDDEPQAGQWDDDER